MSCFYCAGAEVNSHDVGPCEGACAKHVCVVGTTARPNDYHADRCGCGCAKLICIYDMRSHVQLEHPNMPPGHCFHNSAAHAGLAAGEALERSAEFGDRTPGSDKDKYGRAIYRFLEIVPIEYTVLPRRLGAGLDTPGLAGKLFTAKNWERLAASLAPHVVLTIARYWPRVSEPQLAGRVDPEFERRLEVFLKSGYAESERLPENGTAKGMLQAWFDFSPRLTMLIVQHGSPKTTVVDALTPGLPGFGISPAEPWSAYRRTLELHDFALAGMVGALRGSSESGQSMNP